MASVQSFPENCSTITLARLREAVAALPPPFFEHKPLFPLDPAEPIPLPRRRAHTFAGMDVYLQPLEPPISSEGLYLTVAHNSACNDPWLRGQLAKKMTELTAAGVPQRLLQDNLARWKAQQLRPASTPTE